MQRGTVGKLALAGIVLFVLAASWINESWLYDPFGWVDQWAYLGQAHFFPRLRLLWPGHPSGDLLPLILPAALAHRVFPPVAANFLLDICCMSIVLCVLFLHVRKFAGSVTGLIIALGAGGYQYLLSAVGSSYTDGRVIASYCVGLYLTSLARDAKGRRAAGLLVLAGSAGACMAYTAILSASYLPVFAIYYILRFREAEGALWRQLVRRVARFIAWFPLGIVGMTAVLAAVHFSYTGNWFFFGPTLIKLTHFVGGGYSAPPAESWLPDASWLIVPFAVTLACAVALVRFVVRERTVPSLLSALKEWHVVALLNLASLSIVLFIELYLNQWPLQFLYFDQTLPVTFLGLGALFGRRSGGAPRLTAAFEIALAASGSLLGLWVVGQYPYTYSTVRDPLAAKLELGPYEILAAFVLVTAVVLYGSNRFRFARSLVIAYLLMLNIFSFSPTFGPFLYANTWSALSRPAPINSSKGIYLTTLHVADFVDRIDPERKHALWFNDGGAIGPLLRQVNAVAFLNDSGLRINREFPKLEDFGGFMGSGGRPPRARDRILVLSPDPSAPTQAEAALKAFGLSVESSDIQTMRLGEGFLYAVRIKTSGT